MLKMNCISQQSIFFVDDDSAVCKVVGRTLEQVGAKVTCFERPEDCLEELHSQPCDLLITDLKMPSMSGIELLRKVKRIIPSLPVLVVTGYGDVPVAVEALKAGAADLIEKPLEKNSLLSAVELAISRSNGSALRPGKVLSEVELEVLRLLLAGKTTKEIARVRHRAIRTIEDERSRIMQKIGARNIVELLKRVAIVRLPDVLQKQ
jgi:two-component system response regulator FixJ